MIDATKSLKDWDDFWYNSTNIKCFIDDDEVPCSLLIDDNELNNQIPERY